MFQEGNIDEVRLNRNSEASEVYERGPLWEVGQGSIHEIIRTRRGRCPGTANRETDRSTAAGAPVISIQHITPSLLDPTLDRENVASVSKKQFVLDLRWLICPGTQFPKEHHQAGFISKSLLIKNYRLQNSAVAPTLSLRHVINIIRRVSG